MRRGFVVCVALVALAGVAGFAEKKKSANSVSNLNFVARAQTVAVVIMPGAANPVDNPGANRDAQMEVEQAIRKWGRFLLSLSPQDADIVIAIQKGTSKMMTPTIGGGTVNDRPVIFQPREDGIRIGGSRGTPPPVTSDPTGEGSNSPRMGTSVGAMDDVFEVYAGKQTYPLDSAPLWKYQGKDALKAPKVKAVEEFRKALEEAEKKKP